jgi:DNA-binding transcriptional MerR regulator
MRIGEFAEICGTRISVLRHYDKEGLITPDFIDRFTGYRYYSAEQIGTFMKISALKKAGFSLKEVKAILPKADNNQMIIDVINQKKSELQETLLNLEEAKKILLGAESMIETIITHNQNGAEIKTSPIDSEDFQKACRLLDETAGKNDYQRISGFKTYSNQGDLKFEVRIDAIKLKTEMIKLREDINVPFQNDESVIGKWEVVGDFAVKDDFFARAFNSEAFYGDVIKEIYFLPEGERYWCYGWTKGFLICDTGDGTSLNRYELEEYDGQRYMLIQNKSYYYRRGGAPTVLVLRQLDNKAYTRQGIARKDNIDMPFVDDESVLGKWKAICYCRTKEDFTPGKWESSASLYFKKVEFGENGKCITSFKDDIIDSKDAQVWTKGYLLRKYNQTACRYEIHKDKDIEYLILEWKSGDYRWGGFDTDYYVFMKEDYYDL